MGTDEATSNPTLLAVRSSARQLRELGDYVALRTSDQHKNRVVLKAAELLEALLQQRDEALERVRGLEIEEEHLQNAVIRLGRKLSRCANTLKGEPEPDSLHSTHDVPELVEALKERAEAAERERGAAYLRARFHSGSWWVYDSRYDSDTGPYSTLDEAEEWILGVRRDRDAAGPRISHERFETIISATRGICSSGKAILSMVTSVATEDPAWLARIEELRDMVSLASDAIEEGGPWPDLKAERDALAEKVRELQDADELLQHGEDPKDKRLRNQRERIRQLEEEVRELKGDNATLEYIEAETARNSVSQDDYDAAQSRIRQLEADNAELRKDRERLDWLDAHANPRLKWADDDEEWHTLRWAGVTGPRTIRAAIDAAREGEAE